MNRKYELTTLGCKVNQYESQQLREVLHAHGWRPADAHDIPGLAIINTCAVTGEAGRKSRQLARRATRRGKTPVILVGCNASAEAGRLANLPGVTAVWGHGENAPTSLHRYLLSLGSPKPGAPHEARHHPTQDPQFQQVRSGRKDGRGWPLSAGATDFSTRCEPDEADASAPIHAIPRTGAVKLDRRFSIPITEFTDHQRAFVKVQDGCDAHCTYCIIPSLRPVLGSKPVEAVVEEVAGLVSAGHREVVLTGIFLGAYGRETALRRRWTSTRQPIASLVEAVARVPGLARLRLSSLEPADATDELLAVMRNNPVCVPHLHLPLQTGSEAILRKMNRQYTRADFERMIDRVRAAFDRPAITTDILVGFPGETDANFADTLAVAREAGFCKIHAFPFSPRPGTAAARWSESRVDAKTLKSRMTALRELERELSFAYRRQFVAELQRVLVERCTPIDYRLDERLRMVGQREHRFNAVGRTDRYFAVHFETNRDRTRELIDVIVTRVTPSRTHGEQIRPAEAGGMHSSAAMRHA